MGEAGQVPNAETSSEREPDSNGESSTERPGLEGERVEGERPWLAEWKKPRRLLFVALFILVFGGPFALHLISPKPVPPPANVPGVQLSPVDLASAIGSAASGVDAVEHDLASLGFKPVGDFSVVLAGEPADPAPIRLLASETLPAFAEIHGAGGPAPRLRVLTGFLGGGLLVSSSLDRESMQGDSDSSAASKGVTVLLLPAAGNRALVLRHANLIALAKNDALPETDLSEGRFAYHRQRLYSRRQR